MWDRWDIISFWSSAYIVALLFTFQTTYHWAVPKFPVLPSILNQWLFPFICHQFGFIIRGRSTLLYLGLIITLYNRWVCSRVFQIQRLWFGFGVQQVATLGILSFNKFKIFQKDLVAVDWDIRTIDILDYLQCISIYLNFTLITV